MRKTICVSILVLALCGTTLAGEIECPPLVSSGDINNPPNASQSADAQIIVTPSDAEASATTADVLVETALNAISSVLALL